MSLRIVNPDSEYNYIFLTELLIAQKPILAVGDNPQYTISIVWKRYKFDVNGNVEFDPLYVQNYYSNNFYLDAVTDVGQGLPERITALSANQAAVARIIMEETNMILEAA